MTLHLFHSPTATPLNHTSLHDDILTRELSTSRGEHCFQKPARIQDEMVFVETPSHITEYGSKQAGMIIESGLEVGYLPLMTHLDFVIQPTWHMYEMHAHRMHAYEFMLCIMHEHNACLHVKTCINTLLEFKCMLTSYMTRASWSRKQLHIILQWREWFLHPCVLQVAI